MGGSSLAVGGVTASAFSTPIEQNAVELINERLDTWSITLSSSIDYFTGTACAEPDPLYRVELARSEMMLGKTHQKLAASLVQSVANGTGSGTSSPRSDPGCRSSTRTPRNRLLTWQISGWGHCRPTPCTRPSGTAPCTSM